MEHIQSEANIDVIFSMTLLVLENLSEVNMDFIKIKTTIGEKKLRCNYRFRVCDFYSH